MGAMRCVMSRACHQIIAIGPTVPWAPDPNTIEHEGLFVFPHLDGRPIIIPVSCSISSPARVLLFTLGSSIALPSFPALATTLAPGGRERGEALLAEGDADSAKGEWNEAISKYRASYYGLTRADQASYLGSLPVRKAMRAYQERIVQEQDPNKRRALLQQQAVLLEEFLDAVAAKPGAAEDVGKDVITELEQLRSSIDAELRPKLPEPAPGPSGGEEPPSPDPGPGGGEEPPPPDPGPDPAPDPIPPDSSHPLADEPRRDWLGLGLVIGGSTALATGLGVSVGWWTVRTMAQENVDAGGEDFAPGTEARKTYLADEDARAKEFLIAGSVVAGAGLAIAIGGAVRLVVHRRRAPSRAAAFRVSPLLAPTAAGLVLHRRF